MNLRPRHSTLFPYTTLFRSILNKRDAFRLAFAGFDAARVARFGARDVERLLGDVGIVRHRGKIVSAIGNARRALAVAEEFGSDRKSTRLNSSHSQISYAVFC